ncbi:MAG: hypothetical protein TREMPRED_000531 [Tremellales sp. Tagirdzhanova-0007]|nr:MAG: hypothetical protein TREMPRED_000531 [Tremellales sp. Tagirdzhanova-0007]
MSSDAAPSQARKRPSPAVDFIAGTIAGAAGLVVGQPFDVVKVRFQTPQYAGRYVSTFGALATIMREEKMHGLFKGVTSPMAGIAFINGLVFASYSFFMRLQIQPNSSQEPTLGQIFLAGAGSGMLSSLVTCPTELIKIRQQSAPPHLNPSTLSLYQSILRQDGLRGLYRGLSATMLRDLAYGPYFLTYESVCRIFKWAKQLPSVPSKQHHHESLIEEAEEELSSLTWPELMIAGGLAGVTAWMTRMQTMPWDDRDGPRSLSLRHVALQAVRQEGWRVMFAGLGPTLIRAVPVNIVIFLTFEGVCTSMF